MINMIFMSLISDIYLFLNLLYFFSSILKKLDSINICWTSVELQKLKLIINFKFNFSYLISLNQYKIEIAL